MDGKASTAKTLIYKDVLYAQLGVAAKELGYSAVWNSADDSTDIVTNSRTTKKILATNKDTVYDKDINLICTMPDIVNGTQVKIGKSTFYKDMKISMSYSDDYAYNNTLLKIKIDIKGTSIENKFETFTLNIRDEAGTVVDSESVLYYASSGFTNCSVNITSYKPGAIYYLEIK